MKFTRDQKKLANCMSYSDLVVNYRVSERQLNKACRLGDKVAMNKAMSVHQLCEYALLYRQTPEFHKKRIKKC